MYQLVFYTSPRGKVVTLLGCMCTIGPILLVDLCGPASRYGVRSLTSVRYHNHQVNPITWKSVWKRNSHTLTTCSHLKDMTNPTSQYRLPVDVKPTHYGERVLHLLDESQRNIDIKIRTDLEKLTFEGLANIECGPFYTGFIVTKSNLQSRY